MQSSLMVHNLMVSVKSWDGFEFERQQLLNAANDYAETRAAVVKYAYKRNDSFSHLARKSNEFFDLVSVSIIAMEKLMFIQECLKINYNLDRGLICNALFPIAPIVTLRMK